MFYFSRFFRQPHFAPDDGAGAGASAAPAADPAPAAAGEPSGDGAASGKPELTRYGTPRKAGAADRATSSKGLARPGAESRPAADVPAPAEATPEAAQPAAGDAPAADATPEGAEGVVGQEAPQPLVKDPERLLSAIRDAAPGTSLLDAETLPQYVGELHTKATAFDEYLSMVDRLPGLRAFQRDVALGKDPVTAGIEHLGHLAQVPDQDEDPEGYAKYRENQAVKKALAERDALDASAEADRVKTLNNEADAALRAFLARNPGVDAKSFTAEYLSLWKGDPVTGRFRGNAFDILHRGLNHEAIVKAEVAKAVEQAQATWAEDLRVQGGGDRAGLAPLSAGSGGGGSSEGGLGDIDPSKLTKQQRGRLRMAQSLSKKPQRNRYGT